MQPFRRFLISWLLASAGMFGALALVNLMLDPFGLFRLVERVGLNQQKEGVRPKIRFTKALELPLRHPATVLLGSSRVHDGLDPAHALLQQFPPVYNSGINMLRMHEALGYLNHALANAPVKRVVFGLDFFMFNGEERTNPSYDSTLVGRRVRPWDYLYQPLLTKDALMASISTVLVSRETPDRREFLPNGYRPGADVFYHLADYQKAHDYTNYVFLSKDPSQTPYYGRFKLSDEAFRDFQRFVETCRAHEIECIFFITPAHAILDGEGIRLAGLTMAVEEWKRRLVAIGAANGVTLWDFSGYNSVTTEPVRSTMKYYWDSSHFTDVAADLILSRIFGDSLAMAKVPSDFGVRLTTENIADQIAANRAAADHYRLTHPAEVAAITRLARDASRGVPLSLEQTTGMFRSAAKR